MPELLDLLLEGGAADLESRLLLLGVIQKLAGLVQLRLVHGLDRGRLLAPFLLKFVQFVGELAVLGLEEAHFLDVAGKALVEVLHILLLLLTRAPHLVDAGLRDGGVRGGGDAQTGARSVLHRPGHGHGGRAPTPGHRRRPVDDEVARLQARAHDGRTFAMLALVRRRRVVGRRFDGAPRTLRVPLTHSFLNVGHFFFFCGALLLFLWLNRKDCVVVCYSSANGDWRPALDAVRENVPPR